MAASKKKAQDEKKRTDNPGNRKYATAADLRAKCDEYFALCDEKGLLYGEAGLALHLDVAIETLRAWYDGKKCEDLQHTVQRAYLQIQSQMESGWQYQEKGMVTKSIFLMKQPRFGGYQDKIEAKQDISVNVKMGDGMDESDFK